MPQLSRISVYPVKSLDGIDVATSDFMPGGGLRNDRRFALRDEQGHYVNGKRFPTLHALRAAFADDLSTITLSAAGAASETFRLAAGNAGLERYFSDCFGLRVVVVEDAEFGFPDDLDSPGPTIVAAATLRLVTEWFPGLDLDEVRQRFRANLEIDDTPDEACPPFWEDRLFAADAEVGARSAVTFRIGNVLLDGVNPCARCVVPTRDSQTGAVTPRFVAEFQRHRAAALPAWAAPTAFDHFYRLSVNTRPSPASHGGTISMGDAVAVV
jgi:uncharacterized protein YcbX